MAINTLTDTKCKQAKATERPRKLFDGGGLYLWVSPAGGKIWRVAYRLHEKQQTKSLGSYPALGLAAARVLRDAIKTELIRGVDPMADRKMQRSSVTLEEAMDAYWGGRKDLSPKYIADARRAIELHVYPRFKSANLAILTREDVMSCLRALDAEGKHVYVRKVRMWLGMVLDWAVEQGYCSFNPCALIDPRKAFGRSRVVHMAALSLREVPALMQRIAMEPPIQSIMACRLMAYTWLRTAELRSIRWTDIDHDLLSIPEGRMKKGREHVVPLSRQALELLEHMRMRSRGSEFVFPNDRRLDRSMSENAILYMLYRLGYKGKMTGHGWRSVASSWANERGFDKDAIERQLAHSPENKVRAAYNRAEFLEHRREMLQKWADWLDLCQVDASGVQSGQPPA